MSDISWRQHVRARLTSLRLSPAREAEIVEELSQHLDERYEELRGGGASDADARRLAIDELLDRDTLANDMRALRQANMPATAVESGTFDRSLIGDRWRDVGHAVRMLRKQPAFAAAALLTIALGIGATTAIFSVVNSVLIKPLPYADSDALVRIVHSIGKDQPYFSDAIYWAYVRNTQTLQDVGVWMPASRATITGQGDPEEVRTLTANRGLLTTLAVQPEVGRWFSREEDSPGAPGTVILSHRYWHRTFGGDRSVLDRTLVLDGRPYRIIGVMPRAFHFDGDVEMLLPLRSDPAKPVPFFRLVGVARLKPGVTLAQANADSRRILLLWLNDSGQKDPAFQARYQPALRSFKQDVVGDIGATLWVLMGAIGIVLLLACANVANLMLVRADARRKEFAIRAALGAGWTVVARQLLVESLTLAVLGGVLGVGLAYAGLRMLVAIGPSSLPRLSEVAIDPLVLVFALVCSLGSGLLFGFMPILKYGRPQLVHAIGGRGLSLSAERQRSQHVLVVAQMTLALVLLVSAGLMIRSFRALGGVDPGFARPHRVQTFAISIPRNLVTNADVQMRLQHQVLEKVRAIPGVTSAAFTTRLPTDPTDRWSAALSFQDVADDGRTPPNHQVKLISPHMFETLGTSLVAGRDFTWSDLYDVRDVAIISENLARQTWGSAAAAIGKRTREYYGSKDAPWRDIVGVARDVYDDGLYQAPPATIYWPARVRSPMYQPRRVSIAIRTDLAGTEGLLHQVRTAVSSVHDSIAVAQAVTLGELYEASMAPTSFALVMLAIAGTMALLLSVSGLYGVLSYAVSQRRREIGIRVALGAQAHDIRSLFVRRGLLLAGIGAVFGIAGAIGSTRLMESLLFGVSPLDPLTFAVMPVVLTLVAVLASYLPACRAVAVDPVETMRVE
jgi:predicted permease